MSKQSREAFHAQIASGSYKTNMAKVYQVLTHPDGVAAANLDSFREYFSGARYMPHQTLTSCLSALCDMGVVVQNSNGFWYAAKKEEWEANATARMDEKYQKWVAKGNEMDWHYRHNRESIFFHTDVL